MEAERLVFGFENGKISIRDPNGENGLKTIVILGCTSANADIISHYLMEADPKYNFTPKELFMILRFAREFYTKVVTLISLNLPSRTPPGLSTSDYSVHTDYKF